MVCSTPSPSGNALRFCLLLQGLSISDIETICKAAADKNQVTNHYLDVHRRTLERDVQAIRQQRLVKLDTITIKELGAVLDDEAEMEKRELWSVVRSCTKDQQGIKVQAIRALGAIRAERIKVLQLLGIIAEKPILDDLFEWLLGMTDAEREEINRATDEELEEILRKRYGSGPTPLRLLKGPS